MKIIGYFEEYECACISKCVRFKKDLLGYCADHGRDRRQIFPVPDNKIGREQMEEDKEKNDKI